MDERVWARRLLWAGPVGVVAAWIVIGVAWLLNGDWFVFTRDAFSDLGGPGACCPRVYNTGLILVGVIVAAFGAGLVLAGRSKLEVVGGAYFALAGVFLALIGIYPSGTRPHTFVSTWFFVQADLGLLLASLGLYRAWGCRLGLWGLVLSALAFPVAGLVEAVVGWPSAAVLEAYGILVIDAVVLALFTGYRRVLAEGAGPAEAG